MKRFGKNMVMVILCWLFLGNIAARAEESGSATIDFVLVVDCTGSLSESDPLKWGVEAAKLFVETLPTENVRVSVIGFGAEWDTMEVYTIKGADRTFNLVTEAFPLSNSGEEMQNDRICKVLEQIGDESGNYTQIGYALSAAVDVLEQGKADQDSACIILVSDGRITGQSDYIEQEENYERYKCIEDAISVASLKEWPVYCLELNYDKLNGESGWQGRLAREQLEHISGSTGGERIEVTGTDTVLHKFTEIIEQYFDVQPDKDEIVLQDKKAVKKFTVAEMTAETNIIVSGKELDRINRIAITDPDGNTKDYQENSYTESRRVIFNSPHYIMSKLIKPNAGEWAVTAYGDDGVKIEIQIIPLQEVELKLNTLKDLSSGVYRNELVEFTAHFAYNDQSYSSDTFYEDSNAFLEILETGEKFPMKGNRDNYEGAVSFERAGSYTVCAVVEDGIFRNDRKVSENYNIQVKVESIAPLSESIPDQTMAVGSSLTLDCSKYFNREDNGQIIYSASSSDKTALSKCDITEEGVLIIEAGEKAGTFQMSVSGKDVDLEEPDILQFSLAITNEKPRIQGEEQINLELVAGSNSVFGKLASLFHMNLQNEMVLDLGRYFADPENLPLQYQREYGKEMGDSHPFTAEVDESNCILSAEETGIGTVYLQAIDCCGETSDKITVYVKVVESGEFFFEHTKVFWIILVFVILVLAIVVAAVFGKRKIYGTWKITINYEVPMSVQFRRYEQGSKAKCRLSELLNAIQPFDFQSGDVMICAGNNITKKVILKGLDKCPDLLVKKNEEELKMVKTLACNKKSRDLIELTDKIGNVVRLERIG